MALPTFHAIREIWGYPRPENRVDKTPFLALLGADAVASHHRQRDHYGPPTGARGFGVGSSNTDHSDNPGFTPGVLFFP
jgi:hypothetical protein